MTFFDSESLCDVMNEIYNCGVTGKRYRLLFKMNEKSIIQVKTPVGRTRTIKRQEGLSQGTVEASALSSGNIGKGVEEYFGDSEHEIFYGDVRLQPMSFVDDVARMAANRLAAQAGINLMQTITETKLLNYHLDKSSFMVVGIPKVTEKLEEELKKNPLILCDKPMKRASNYSYLGTVISEKGVGESVMESVKSKLGKVKHLIFEIKAVLESCKNIAPGAFLTSLLIWESAVVPYLFHSSECWFEIPKKTLLSLNSITETFLRVMLACPRSTPIVAMYWEVGMSLPENRILYNKLLFYYHIVNLGEDTLAYKICQEQRRLKLGGLVKESLGALAVLGIEDEKVKTMNKIQFKKLVCERIKMKNKEDLLFRMKTSKKFSFLSHKDEDFDIKPYFKSMKLHECRTMFGIRSMTTETIKSHQMSNKDFAKKLWLCKCGETDSISHVKRCLIFEEIRTNLDIENNETDMVKYFQEVIRLRNDTPEE